MFKTQQNGILLVLRNTIPWHQHNLHWLPVQQRITFKIATLMYHVRHRCLNGLAPPHLAADRIIISLMPLRQGRCTFQEPGQQRSFKVFGFTIWNDLPTCCDEDPSLIHLCPYWLTIVDWNLIRWSRFESLKWARNINLISVFTITVNW